MNSLYGMKYSYIDSTDILFIGILYENLMVRFLQSHLEVLVAL